MWDSVDNINSMWWGASDTDALWINTDNPSLSMQSCHPVSLSLFLRYSHPVSLGLALRYSHPVSLGLALRYSHPVVYTLLFRYNHPVSLGLALRYNHPVVYTLLFRYNHPVSLGLFLRYNHPVYFQYGKLAYNHNVSVGLIIRDNIIIIYSDPEEKRSNYAMPHQAAQEMRYNHAMPISEYNPLQTMRNTHPVSYQTSASVQHSIVVEVYLNDEKITHLISNVTIEYNEKNPHNTVEIECISPQLYVEVLELIDTAEITVHTDSQIEKFLLKDVQGRSQSFKMYGLSYTSSIQNTETEVTIGNDGQSAAAVAANVFSGVSWEVLDWVFDQYSLAGTGISILKRLAETCGAIVRCDIDDSVFVRYRYPVRPVDMQSADYDCIFRASNILNINIAREDGDGYNQVDILGPSLDENNDYIIVVESDPSPEVGKDAFVRVYFPVPISAEMEAFISAGLISIEEGFRTETIEDERITFEDGYGQSQFPIKSISSFTWSGEESATVEADAYSRILTSSGKWDSGLVTYETEYIRLRLYNHNTDYLRGKLEVYAGTGSSVRAVLGTGDNPNPDSVQDELIRNVSVATKRAEAIFDNNYYDRDVITISAPVTAANMALIDGQLIYLSCPEEEIDGIAKIRSVRRKYQKIHLMEIEAEICSLTTS